MKTRSRALIYFAKDAAATDDIIFVGTDANERALNWRLSATAARSLLRDAPTGATISEKVTVASKVFSNRYKALKTFPDGSVAYLSMGTTSVSVQVVRCFRC
ncbi:Hypothetical protein PHPALM_8736 [Phytophthora palmivora]|uniref:Uncharacterized protein n=1 Tax=Phytophthora palmivora TaxID=4796 RepID=A0A2P4Y937_9STRA|nr:Hypothetical protein PHPALM_8736 [Phytophthora palmivora]